jgi:hypothetical protein
MMTVRPEGLFAVLKFRKRRRRIIAALRCEAPPGIKMPAGRNGGHLRTVLENPIGDAPPISENFFQINAVASQELTA